MEEFVIIVYENQFQILYAVFGNVFLNKIQQKLHLSEY